MKAFRRAAALSVALVPLLATPGISDESEQFGYPTAPPSARTDDFVCYMQTNSGQTLDLGVLCIDEVAADEPALGTGDIQTTLRWSTIDDLDLAVRDPSGQVVFYQNRRVPSGGALDVDSNADCQNTTATPVENVFWPPGEAPQGNYVVEVSLFRRCGGGGPIPYNLTLLVKGETQTQTGTLDEQNPTATFPISLP